jgi:hypothetical protein
MVCDEKTTTCTYEFNCDIEDIVPLPQKETPVPYKIASFDIEASSSHGDFPVPIKDYKRMATQTIDLYDQKRAKQNMNVDSTKAWLKKAILSVFSIGSSIDGLDVVYTKNPILKDEIKECVKLVFEKTLEHESLNKESTIMPPTNQDKLTFYIILNTRKKYTIKITKTKILLLKNRKNKIFAN